MGNITFAKPPLVEVSFGVMFDRLPTFTTAYFGRFWDEQKDEFPETLDAFPLGLAASDFNPASVSAAWFPPARVWLVHRSKELLLQLQQDRFLLNWRRIAPDAPYPRFQSLLPCFLDQMQRFAAFVEDQGRGVIKPSACELTYVNHVTADDKWSGFNALGQVFVDFDWKRAANRPAKPAGVNWQAVWAAGSYNVRTDVKTAVNPDGEVALLEIKAEATTPVTKLTDVEGWFEGANQAIVAAFVDMTTPWAQHELWHREKT